MPVHNINTACVLFSLLKGDELELLDYRWRIASKEKASDGPEKLRQEIIDQINQCKNHKRNAILARAAFIPLHLIIM